MGQDDQAAEQIVVTGAAGRIGRLLHLVWAQAGSPAPGAVLWTSRQKGGVVWHLGHAAPPLPAKAVFVHLAAVLRGPHLDQNATMTEAVCRTAIASGARHVFVVSTAAVYRPGADLAETAALGPVSAYGQAKLEAERVAERRLCDSGGPGLTVLRIGNLAGADALLGGLRAGHVAVLDPVATPVQMGGQAGGPLRSYIGPGVLAQVLAALIQRAMTGAPLPRVLNLAQPGVVAMADLLTAAGHPWRFGPVNPAVIPVMGLAVGSLASLVPAALLPPATAPGLLADLRRLQGLWP